MLRENDCIKEFKNGNLHIKYSADHNEWETLSGILEWLDCYFVGEEFCLGNYDMGRMIYNVYSDLVYVFRFGDIEKLEEGKTLILYGRKPDDEEREEIEKEFSAE